MAKKLGDAGITALVTYIRDWVLNKIAATAARYLNVDTTIYVSTNGTGDGSAANKAMSINDMWTYLATAKMLPTTNASVNSKILTIKFAAGSYGEISLDANKMPGIRNLTIDTSSTTAVTVDNYSTNTPTFTNIYVLGGPLHVTIKNVQCSGIIQAEWHSRIILNTFARAASFRAVNYGRLEFGAGTYSAVYANKDYLVAATEFGQIILNSATMTFHFEKVMYYTGGIFIADTCGRLYLNYGRCKFTGTQPVVALNVSGTLTGTSSTAAATAAKEVTLASGQTFTLATNAVAYVKFTNDNTAENPTLNINGTGAKPIFFGSAAIPAKYLCKAIQYKFTYNGTNYVCNNSFQRVEVASTDSLLNYGSNYNTTYNSGAFNWTGFSRLWQAGANVNGTVYGAVSGNASSATQVRADPAAGNTANLVYSKMATNDVFRIQTGGAANAGYAEIATGDDYNEPIYVRQYQGEFATLKRSATLLDENGDTLFPGTVTASGFNGKISNDISGSYVQAVTAGGAVVTQNTTTFGGVWNAPTKSYRVGCGTFPSTNELVYLAFSVTNENIAAGSNTLAKALTWDASNGTLTANAFSGNASTATQFNANTTVALTGDATGTSAGSKKGWSVPVTLANSGVTAGTYGPSADVTGNNNATISVPQITVDSKGRVTSVTNRTLTCKNNTYSVYNKTLTIQKNGTNVATFTSNSNTDVTANITVPTKTSELTNDSGFLTSHQSLSNYVTLNSAQTITGAKTLTANLTLKNTAITNYKANPSADTSAAGLVFTSNENKFWGAVTHVYYTSGVSGMRLEMSNWTTSGSQGWWYLEYGVDKAFSQVYFKPSGADYCNLGTSSEYWKFAYAGEYRAYHANAFLANQGGYTFLIRNDGGSTYFLMSAQNGNEGTWTTARPLTIVNSTGVCNINGTATNVTGTVAIANGGTGATTRLNAVKALTNENVGTGTQYFLTITSNWGKAGYCSVADAKTVLDCVTLSSAQTISSQKIFTTMPAMRNMVYELGTTPSEDRYAFIEFFDKNAIQTGWVGRVAYTNGYDVVNISCINKFSNGAKSKSGSNIHSVLEVGLTPTGVAYLNTNAGWMSSVWPLANGGADLGSTTNQWNQIYAVGANLYYGLNTGCIELNPDGLANRGDGGYIDFHYNHSTADFTSRIIEDGSGLLNINDTKIPTGQAKLLLQQKSLVKGTNPSSVVWTGIYFNDKTYNVSNPHRYSCLEISIDTNGTVSTYLRSYNWVANNTASACIAVHYPVNGTAYTEAPTPAAGDNSTKIATTAFVRSEYVRINSLAGGNTAGSLTHSIGSLVLARCASSSLANVKSYPNVSGKQLYPCRTEMCTSYDATGYHYVPIVVRYSSDSNLGSGTWRYLGGSSANINTSAAEIYGMFLRVA